jgi:hypothetical protein
MAISGFEPLLSQEGESLSDGSSMEDGVLRLSPGALCAADYILSAEAKKLFSFRLSDEALSELSKKTEGYLLAHLDRAFRTLDYYHKI